MKLSVRIDGREAPLVFEFGGGVCRFRFDGGEEREAALAEMEPGVYSVIIGGRSYEAKIESGLNGVFVRVGGRRFAVEVRDPRHWMRDLKGRYAEGRANLVAPIPGRVVRVLVSEGETVEAGQGLLVVEAMKMQNEMKSPRPGRVASLSVSQGDTVVAGQVLAAVE